jgi:nicotinamidase-related amidase
MRIIKENTIGFIIDFQERLMPHMHNRDELIRKSRILIQGLKLLQIPLIYTEQYPKGLGRIIDPISELLLPDHPFEKIAFSCCDDPAIMKQLQSYNKKTILISGIEAHVCVVQTVLDLIDTGYQPVVIADCTASRNDNDKEMALKRIIQEGGRVATVESILFELMRTAEHESFKALSELVK